MQRVLLSATLCYAMTSSIYAKAIPPGELLQWNHAGIGSVSLNGDQISLAEGANSAGMMLISPEPYLKNFVLKFSVKPNQHNGVLVVVTNASSVNGNSQLPVPADYNGNWNFWKDDTSPIQSYAFAFHTGYHQPLSFIRKNPGYLALPEGSQSEDVATEERWYKIEVGNLENRLWLKVDNIKVLDTHDSDHALPGGHIAFRVRGPGDGSFCASYKEVEISEIASENALPTI